MNASTIRCLITAGPTREWFDPVRFISNPSSGRMGFALAYAAAAAGWSVDLVSGPTALPEPENPNIVFYPVVTGEEMFHQVDGLFDPCDILIMCAAVCDMRPKQYEPRKQKKDSLEMTMAFEPVVDILKTMAARKRPSQRVVGFAAETHSVEAHARDKLEAKGLDYIVANKVGEPGSGFEAGDNAVVLLGADGSRRAFGPAGKEDIAEALIAALRRQAPA